MMSADLPLAKKSVPARPRRLRDRLIAFGLVAMFALGVVGLFAATGWEETRAQIARLTGMQILLLLVLSLGNYLLRGLRWHLFARRLGLPTSLAQDMRHFLGGFAMVVTPGRVGELVRMRWLKRETGWSLERTAPLALMDRAADLAAMALILALCVAFATTGVRGAAPVALLALAAAFTATHPRLLAWIVTQVHRLVGRMPRLFGKLRAAARSLDRFSGAGTMVPALALGMTGWLAEGYAFHLLLGWMGTDIGLMKAIAIFIFSTLAGGLTGAPGGVGGAEAAMIALLSLDGVPMEVSVPATAIIRVTTLWFALGIGMAVFPVAERLSVRGQNAVEDN
ncbi:MAG: flippase-like domain-containing protein [Rhodobacteraceae bacterium]|nr:flippase-like domain-containing protein [Paracoccaceae bacterium]